MTHTWDDSSRQTFIIVTHLWSRRRYVALNTPFFPKYCIATILKMIDRIPVDIQLRIISYLSADDIYSVGEICQDWKVLYENRTIAQKIINRDIEELTSVDSELLMMVQKGLCLNEYVSIKVNIVLSQTTKNYKVGWNVIVPKKIENIGAITFHPTR